MTKPEQQNVFLFIPNVIGYGRIVLAVMSFYFMLNAPIPAAFCYALSAFLDAFDGYAARYMNQCSRLGAMLDQLTDRCATLALIMCLAHFYPSWMLFFQGNNIQLSAVIDIASHWLHLHAADLTGATTHKQSSFAPLHLYYTSRPFLFFMCFGNEAFYSFLYLAHFYKTPLPIIGVNLWIALAGIFSLVNLAKTAISLLHLATAATTVADYDILHRNQLNQKTD